MQGFSVKGSAHSAKTCNFKTVEIEIFWGVYGYRIKPKGEERKYKNKSNLLKQKAKATNRYKKVVSKQFVD